jgi:hypothetical protein
VVHAANALDRRVEHEADRHDQDVCTCVTSLVVRVMRDAVENLSNCAWRRTHFWKTRLRKSPATLAATKAAM